MLDENNPLNNIKADDIYTEDDLFHNNDSKDKRNKFFTTQLKQ